MRGGKSLKSQRWHGRRNRNSNSGWVKRKARRAKIRMVNMGKYQEWKKQKEREKRGNSIA